MALRGTGGLSLQDRLLLRLWRKGRSSRRGRQSDFATPSDALIEEGGPPARQVRERASGLLRCPGHILRWQSKGRRPRLPADLYRQLCEVRSRQAVRSQDADQGRGSAQ
jgi:hypothetical protein